LIAHRCEGSKGIRETLPNDSYEHGSVDVGKVTALAFADLGATNL